MNILDEGIYMQSTSYPTKSMSYSKLTWIRTSYITFRPFLRN